MMASCAISKLFIAWFINLLMPGLVFLKGVIPLIMVGMYPQLSSNGANLAELLVFEFIANLVIGNCQPSQIGQVGLGFVGFVLQTYSPSQMLHPFEGKML
jgi:hypothetical protein